MAISADAAATRSPAVSYRQPALWRRMVKIPTLVIGGFITLSLILLAVLAPVLATHDPSAQNLLNGLQPPSADHWLGTDQLGRDVYSRILFGAQTDLRIAGIAVIAPFIIGVTIGLLSGYFGGKVDWILSRVLDVVVAFPFYVIVIAIVFAVGAGERGIYLALALVGWVSYARVVRAQTQVYRGSGWVLAARGGGISSVRILRKHIFPNVITQAIVLLMTDLVFVIVAVVTLSYLGLGVQPPTPDWGTMIFDGQPFLATKWWLSAIPGFMVVYAGVGFALLGDGLADLWRNE